MRGAFLLKKHKNYPIILDQDSPMIVEFDERYSKIIFTLLFPRTQDSTKDNIRKD